MARRRPLVLVAGVPKQLPAGDTLPGGVTYYTRDGVIQSPKVYVDILDLSGLQGGIFTVDYSHVGFTKIHNVQLTGEASAATLAGRRLVGIRKDAVTTTGLSGDLMSATSGGLIASTLVEASDGKVHLKVIGE